MILAKAPLRVSFFGGSSDIPAYYLKYTGATISMAIDKYVYVAVMHTPHKHIKISYSEQELVTDVNDIKNDIVRECLKYVGIKSNIEITTFADMPTVGTGLGGSSAFTCALLIALYAHIGQSISSYELASLACHIEIDLCKWNIGKQDQYASAFGGMNHITYGRYEKHDFFEDKIEDKVIVQKMNYFKLSNRMILVPTKGQRHSSKIIDSIDFEEKKDLIHRLSVFATNLKYEVPEYYKYAEYLNKSWKIKEKLSKTISNKEIDLVYKKCMEANADACKLLGAGGGGYMLVMSRDINRIKETFPERICLEFNLAEDGAKIVYRD